jgi:hypothetical protein
MTPRQALLLAAAYLLGLYSHVVIRVIRGEIWRDSGARPGDASWREREVVEGV